jgi:EAL domain-containing protein (putative c-di-GMP-specific phosphodiesterase class I)
LVSPSIFIPIAEKTDFIQELGEWIFKEAFAQLNHWQMNKNLFLQMAINVSTLQIAKKDFVKTIRNLLKPYSFDPKYLELEITESSLVEFIPETLSTFHELKKLGVKIALDDFGTGYSNFSHLSSCPFDILKVDQSFVRGKVGDQRNATILNAIFQLANSLNLKTVVEGIENEQELNFISAYPCDEVQGYYFGKPMGADSIEQLLLL